MKNSNSEPIEMTIKMIKAFSKSEIKKLSPCFNAVVAEMLDSLPIPKHKKKKSNKKGELEEHQHRREFSFADKNQELHSE